MSKSSESNINPRIRHTSVGIRTLRTIKLFPLSMKDQMDFSDIIQETLSAFFSSENSEKSDREIVAITLGLIKNNLQKILDLITDPEEKVSLSEIDTTQGTEIANLIFEANYGNEDLVKNVTSLLGQIKKIFLSGRQQLTSVNDTQDTD